MDLIIDGVRWVLWLLCKGCFFLVDSIYNIIKPILAFDIGADPLVWSWWNILCGFLFLFTIIRVTSMLIKGAVDEDYMLKMNPFNIYIRIIIIGMTIALFPLSIKSLTSLSSTVMDNASRIFKVESNFASYLPKTDNKELQEMLDKALKQYEGMPSQIFIASASNGKYPPYQLIEINKTDGIVDNWFNGVPILGGFFDLTSGLIGLDGDYIYFPDTTILIFLLVEGICAMYMFLLMAIQISQRMFSIGVKILISPYAISGIVNPDDRSFGLWGKLLLADLISNVLQFIILLLVLALTSSKTAQNFGIVGQGIFFLGGMLAVLVGPGQVAQIIGGDGMGLFMTMQGFQAMSALKGITSGVGHFAANAITGAAALGTYGAGRMMGMNSLGNFPNGITPDNPMHPLNSGPFNNSSGAFSDAPTRKQLYLADKLDVAGKFGVDPSQLSKGQLSQMLEAAGADESYWAGYNPAGATGTINTGQKTYGFDNTAASGYATSGRYENPEGNGSSEGNNMSENNNSMSQGNNSNSSTNVPPPIRMSKENSFARRISDSNSIGMNVAAKIGRTAYINSGKRLMGQKMIARGGRYISANTKAQNLSNLRAGIYDLYNKENKDNNDSKK